MIEPRQKSSAKLRARGLVRTAPRGTVTWRIQCGRSAPASAAWVMRVVGLDDEADVEQLARVVELRQPADQTAGDFALAVERHEDRDGGQAQDIGGRGLRGRGAGAARARRSRW